MGAKINKNKLELEGKIVFQNSFNPSAMGCNKPKNLLR